MRLVHIPIQTDEKHMRTAHTGKGIITRHGWWGFEDSEPVLWSLMGNGGGPACFTITCSKDQKEDQRGFACNSRMMLSRDIIYTPINSNNRA